jgi:hypothetical protein
VISYLGNVANTAEKLKYPVEPNIADIVVWKLGWQPECFLWVTVSQREPGPVQWDPTNHYHVGVITPDLEFFDLGIDVGFQEKMVCPFGLTWMYSNLLHQL